VDVAVSGGQCVRVAAVAARQQSADGTRTLVRDESGRLALRGIGCDASWAEV
jgi:hypothetical protein